MLVADTGELLSFRRTLPVSASACLTEREVKPAPVYTTTPQST